MMPLCPRLGFAMGLGHEKREWQKDRSSDWYDRIVKYIASLKRLE